MRVRIRRGKPIMGRRRRAKLRFAWWDQWSGMSRFRQYILRLVWWATGDRNHKEIECIMKQKEMRHAR